MPTVQKLHLDKMLSEISIGYSNEQYIADQIFKPVVVNKQSDRYYVFGMEKFRLHDDLRSPGTAAHEIDWEFSHDTFYCEGHALRHRIADEEYQNNDGDFDLEAEATELITEGILLNKEVNAANLLLDSSNYHADLRFNVGDEIASKWSDYIFGACNSNPIYDIEKAKERMHKLSGLRPNTLIISEVVYRVLTMHPKLLDVIKYVQRGIVTMDLMKSAFGVDNILIGSAMKSDVQNPGQVAPGAIENLDYIWGNSVVLAYVPSRPARRTPAIGYTFLWNKDGNGPVQVRKWYDQDTRATVIEAERWYAHKMISNIAGVILSSVVDPIGA